MTKNGYANVQRATSSMEAKKVQKTFCSGVRANASIPFNNKTVNITGKTVKFRHV